MLGRAIDFCLDNRWAVVFLLAAVVVGGVLIAVQLPMDAFPDLTNNQVVVHTECPGMPPTEVEQLVTFPIESALMGLPNTEGVRSVSKLGLSMVTVVFDDSVNSWFARQIVNERLQEARSRIPEGLEPQLGPMATAFGELYQYTVEGPQSLTDRKTLHDWYVRHQLRSVRGVNEVNTWGGSSLMYTVEVDPEALLRYGVTLRQVFDRLRENNENFGGGFIEHSGEQYTVLGLGRTSTVEDIGRTVLLQHEGTPVLVRDVARVYEGALPRQGAVTRDGRGETVSGMAIMLKGENGLRLIDSIKERLNRLQLPPGVKLVPFYDQSQVILGTIRTVSINLLEAGALVTAVLLLFLGNIRAALIVVAVIPLSMLFGFAGMALFGVSANLMSLGAIDFGMIVDGSIVMVENSVRRRNRAPEEPLLSVIRAASHEVARPIVFGVLIIIAVYLPIFAFEGLEKRMFRPMAITMCSALFGSLVLALFAVPAMSTFALRTRGKAHRDPAWFVRLMNRYRHALSFVLRHRTAAVAAALVPLIAAGISLFFIGTEFMPRLDEGSILVQSRKLPGISLTDSVALGQKAESVLLSFPEVTSVVSKVGRPDLATEAMGIYESDVYVLLKPQRQWTTAKTKEGLISAMAERLESVPGTAYNFTQPMAMRLDETISGIKADVAVKIFGDDERVLEQLADRTLRVLSKIPGAADVQAEVISGVAELRIEADRTALARYGLNIADVRDVINSTTGGLQVSEMIQGQRRFPIAVRLPERYRDNFTALGSITMQAPGGERVHLTDVARIEPSRGPEIVSRENAQRRIVVQSNVRGRDLGSFVEEAQAALRQQVTLPPGYSIDWGGQFENQERAMRRLIFVVPLSIAIISGLLYLTFQSWSQAALILLNVPFAFVGGIALLWIRGMNLNLSAAIGFVALFGVAVLNGIVMVSYMNQVRARGVEMGEAILEGASARLRPVIMTWLVASLGFVPMALSQAMGSEVQRPLATVVIGGLITSTLLTLFLIPALYPWFTRQR